MEEHSLIRKGSKNIEGASNINNLNIITATGRSHVCKEMYPMISALRQMKGVTQNTTEKM